MIPCLCYLSKVIALYQFVRLSRNRNYSGPLSVFLRCEKLRTVGKVLIEEESIFMSEVNEQIRIMVVEDHALVRDGICQLLSRYPDIKIVATAGSATEATDLVTNVKPDLALVDIRLPDKVGYLAIEDLKKSNPKIKVLIVSAYNDLVYVQESLKMGASGYLLKTATADELYEAIKTAFAGTTVLDSSLAVALALNLQPQFENLGIQLSEKEIAIVNGLGDGLSNRQIAASMNISVRTVEGYITELFNKLGLNSRTKAAIWAINNGFGSNRSYAPEC